MVKMAKQTTTARAKAVQQDQSGSPGEPEETATASVSESVSDSVSEDALPDSVSFITSRKASAGETAPASDDPGGQDHKTDDSGGKPRRALKGKKRAARKRGNPETTRATRKAGRNPEQPDAAPSPAIVGQDNGLNQPELELQGVRPVAGPARLKKRHWGVIASFLVFFLVPTVAAISYLFIVAEDQYHSITGFTVRTQNQSAANDVLSGLANFAGGSTASDSDILFEFIQSQEMVQAIDQRIDLRKHYARYWPRDWAFSIWPDATQEELIWYWNRMVSVSYDSSTGLINVLVRAFDPLTAQNIATAIVAESQDRINELNRKAREDSMRYAQTDLDDAVERLTKARQAMTAFRTSSQIVDPQTDLQTRMGVMSSLQQQLASALIEFDLLQGSTSPNDPRLTEAQKRIDVIRDRIAIERRNFASSSTDTGGVTQDYPSLMSDYERLQVDLKYAEEAYVAALKAFDAARDEADRNSRFLATYINPTRAEESEYPQRFVLSGLIALFTFLIWSIGVLVYYSIRDRS